MRKVIVLTSGGLDSILALTIMKNEGLDVTGLHCFSLFTVPKYRDFEPYPARDTFMRIPRINIDVSKEQTAALLNPLYGYGSAVNPCIDCKLIFFKKARELMEEMHADFVATGEVLGQRPMTQQSNIMRMLEKRSGLEGYLLRPLSARLMNPTIPEKRGWVNRERLYDISGRGRKRQIKLASHFGIKEYPAPAGGCLLTEKSFTARFNDLVACSEDIALEDVLVLKYGRHFRISEGCKLVVGKNQAENEYLKNINWGNITIDLNGTPGPYSLLMWDGKVSHLRSALGIVARYCVHKAVGGKVIFKVKSRDNEKIITYEGVPDKDRIRELIIR